MFDEKGPNNLPQAILWTIHVIQTANRFVQYVGQGVRITVLSNGKVASFDGEMFSARLGEIERRIGDIWYNACDGKLSQEELRRSLEISTNHIATAHEAFLGLIQLILKPLIE